MKPRVSSKRWAALMRPRLPSLMRSGRLSPWFWYCLATETTKRRFALVSFSNASWSPSLIFRANSTSSSAVISSTLPISCRYLSNEAVSRFVTCLVMFNCLIFSMLFLNIFCSNSPFYGCFLHFVTRKNTLAKKVCKGTTIFSETVCSEHGNVNNFFKKIFCFQPADIFFNSTFAPHL